MKGAKIMTGRELVIHILSNGLEEADISDLFLTEDEAAVRLNVGVATIKAWSELGLIQRININGKTYVLPSKTLNRFEEQWSKTYENTK